MEWVSIFINRYQLIFGYIPVDFIPALMNAETLPKQVDKQVNRDLYGPPSEQKRKDRLRPVLYIETVKNIKASVLSSKNRGTIICCKSPKSPYSKSFTKHLFFKRFSKTKKKIHSLY